MTQLNLNLPVIGDLNATEDPKVRTALSDIQTVVNSLDNTNLAANADINGSKLLNTSVAAGKLVAGILPPAGALMPFAGSAAPTGYLLCEGQPVSRTAYADLFAAISTTYGVGDGSTTFNVPDLRGRVAVGKGTHEDVNALNDNDGAAVGNRRPKHAHSGSATSSPHNGHQHTGSTSTNGDHWHSSSGESANLAFNFRRDASAQGVAGVTVGSVTGSTNTTGNHNHSFTTDSGGAHDHTVSMTVGQTGLNDSPAYVVVNYIIKT